MTSGITISRIQLVFHSIGLSCLGGAIALQIIVFTSILQQGYFRAVEKNPSLLYAEIALTIFTVIYFGYVYQREIKSYIKKSKIENARI